MQSWKLSDDLVGGWEYNGERKLHFFLLPDYKDGKPACKFVLGVHYTDNDMKHLAPDSANRALKLSSDYWLPVLEASTPEDLENEWKDKFPLTPLPPYREFYEILQRT